MNQKQTPKPILALDFDGVIHSYTSGWQGPRNIPDPPVPGAMAFLHKAVDHFEVHIFSSRSRYWFARWAMKQWLVKHLFECFYSQHPDLQTTFDPIREDQLIPHSMAKDLVGRIHFPKTKPPALVTIDDRAITFEGFFPDPESLTRFTPWNKRQPKDWSADAAAEDAGETSITALIWLGGTQ